jgi:hypothetical protein
MRRIGLELSVLFALAGATAVYGQVLATQRAGFGLPAGQVAAPNTPGGAVVVGSNLYTGDGAQGFRHWTPADPANPDPINGGILVYDGNTSFSLGGGGLCLPFCQVGQIAYDGGQNVYFPSYDHQKGNGATVPGVYRAEINPATGTINTFFQLVPTAGLAGNNPTSIALGPDGNLYVGFLKNGNVVRITNPTDCCALASTLSTRRHSYGSGRTTRGNAASYSAWHTHIACAGVLALYLLKPGCFPFPACPRAYLRTRSIKAGLLPSSVLSCTPSQVL